MLHVVVTRKRCSYDYVRDKTKSFDWHNNDNNNAKDTYEIFDGATSLLRCPCQSVSNMEGLDATSKFKDTIAPGTFQLKAFVEGRQHYGKVHGICGTKTIGGETIDQNSVTPTNKLRTLNHDWQKLSPANPPGQDTRVAWSAGCLVIPDKDLEEVARIFTAFGVQPGQYVPAILVEEKV